MGKLIPAGTPLPEEDAPPQRGKLIPAAQAGVDLSNPAEAGGTLQFGPWDTGIPTPPMLDQFLAGAGKAFVDTGRGVKQRAMQAADIVAPRAPGLSDLVTGRDPSRSAAVQRDIDESRRLDAPLMDTGAGIAGNIVGNIAQTAAVPMGGATALARAGIAAGTGAVQGFLQPTATGESGLVNTAIGAGANALGSGIASGIGRVLRPAQAATPEIEAARRFALAHGSDLSYAQITGSELAARVEHWLAKLPGAKQWYAKLGAAQRDSVDKAVVQMTLDGKGGQALQSAGAGKDFISDPQFVDALRSFPAKFDMLAGGMKPAGAIRAAEEYAGTPAAEAAARAPRPFQVPRLDTSKDDAITAIRKFGGIDQGDEAVGSLAKANPFAPHPMFGPVWRQPAYLSSTTNVRAAGHPLDDMALMLHDAGYIPERDPGAVMDLIADATMGTPRYSTHFDHGAAQAAEDPLASAITQLTQQLAVKNAPKAASAVPAKLPAGARIPMSSADPGDFNNYGAIRSQLGKLSFGAAEGTPDAAGYKSLRNIFDATAIRSLEAQGGDPALLGQARNAYQVQKLLQSAQVQHADGSVTYNQAKAANIIERALNNGTLKNLPAETQQTLRDVMNFARNVKPVNSSGTAENAFAGGIATGGILTNAAEHSSPQKLGALAATLYVAPWIVNRGMQAAMRGGIDAPRTASTLARIMAMTPSAVAPSLLESFGQ